MKTEKNSKIKKKVKIYQLTNKKNYTISIEKDEEKSKFTIEKSIELKKKWRKIGKFRIYKSKNTIL